MGGGGGGHWLFLFVCLLLHSIGFILLGRTSLSLALGNMVVARQILLI